MANLQISKAIEIEIERIASEHGYKQEILADFAKFILASGKDKKRIKPLTLPQLKQLVYENFKVNNTTDLRKNGLFKLATSGIDNINLSKKESWEIIYRKTIGFLPNELNENGHGCINGINIFKYDKPWEIFGLNPERANTKDIKEAYRSLSKIYHPDNPETGNAEIFDRLTIFYNSLTESF